jgi:2-keto-4-pentenoate hydratase/2-oxohepta-3-ene-1,7-dioic acid hydratase in catechol pathway
VAGASVLVWLSTSPAGQAAISTRPDTPFKLATFEAGGKVRVGLVMDGRVLDIAGASAHLVEKAHVAKVAIPAAMRDLIEQYGAISPRLYQIANYFKANSTAGLPFAFEVDKVSIKAPIRYPWNLLAAAANYRAHAEGIGAASQAAGAARPAPAGPTPPPGQPGAAEAGGQGRPAVAGFNAAAAALVDPDRDAPVFFAKSPRSCIIDPGEPYYIPAGRDRMDWEAELAIIIGRPAYMVPKERTHDYVFGYSIIYDVSDRGGRRREVAMFSGTNWFDGKSTDRGAPFGPFIVPKEFLPEPYNLRITTRVNGVVKQDGNSKDLIWKEEHMLSYLTSILTLYPGDVISTGTPAGTGIERNEFLKPGDVVTIEIEGIGTLTTPMKAASERPPAPTTASSAGRP